MSHCEVELNSSLSDQKLLPRSKTTAIDDFGHHLWSNISGDVNVVSHGRNPGTEKFDQFVGSRHVFTSVDTDGLTKKFRCYHFLKSSDEFEFSALSRLRRQKR